MLGAVVAGSVRRLLQAVVSAHRGLGDDIKRHPAEVVVDVRLCERMPVSQPDRLVGSSRRRAYLGVGLDLLELRAHRGGMLHHTREHKVAKEPLVERRVEESDARRTGHTTPMCETS